MANYTGVRLRDDIVIDRLYNVHYFEYPKNSVFSEEAHNFSEFIYVDKGSVTVRYKNRSCNLKKGDVIFIEPNELHGLATGNTASNIVAVSFLVSSFAMDFFDKKIFKAGEYHKELISKIISEYSKAFSTPIGDSFNTKNIRRENPAPGSEQLVKQYLCELLIMFIRNHYTAERTVFAGKNALSVKDIAQNYMIDNIGSKLSVADIARHCRTSSSTLSAIFSAQCKMGVIDYFIRLKTEAAKEYIREGNYNITQISELLGYSSVHYFSRQFKKITGMSPGEYSASVSAMMVLKSHRITSG